MTQKCYKVMNWSTDAKRRIENGFCCPDGSAHEIARIPLNDPRTSPALKKKKIKVEYLYLDLKTCDRCIDSHEALDRVMETLTPALELAGYTVEYQKMEMDTAEKAEQYRFLSSPTIRVNGHDIGGHVRESNCSCCSKISNTQVDCRVFEYEGEKYEVPPETMLAEAILKKGLLPQAKEESSAYVMPQNLKNFYKGKAAKQNNCGSNGC